MLRWTVLIGVGLLVGCGSATVAGDDPQVPGVQSGDGDVETPTGGDQDPSGDSTPIDTATEGTVDLSQALGVVIVDGMTREYRYEVPAQLPDGPMPVLVMVHGGDGRNYPFPQESQFKSLVNTEDFILLQPLSELVYPNEGEWQLNTRDDSRHDIAFMKAMLAQIAGAFDVDQTRVYATGYSIGSMFTYELACQMSDRFAAIASYAGTMPVSPASCDVSEGIAMMHIHGEEDGIIAYNNPWDWKEWDSVGTMQAIPDLVDYWGDKNRCQSVEETSFGSSSHIVHSDCDAEVRVEHYRLSRVGHEWPDTIDGRSTHRVIWEFVSGFSK